jgi:lysophospholipase L1-like esterase
MGKRDYVRLKYGSSDCPQYGGASRADVFEARCLGLARRLERKVRSLSWDEALMRTRIGQLVLNCLDNLSNQDTNRLVPRVTLEEYTTNLNEIIHISAARQLKVVLLTRPFTGTDFDPQYNAATLELADRAGIPAVDVYSFFKGCTDCFVDESHFTEKGMRLMAELLYEKIHEDVEARKNSTHARLLPPPHKSQGRR